MIPGWLENDAASYSWLGPLSCVFLNNDEVIPEIIFFQGIRRN